MVSDAHHEPVAAARSQLSAIRDAFADLLSQEFRWSPGHLAALLNGCVFAPSLLTFWLVNGAVDFTTAFVVGAVASPAGLWVRLLAYVLLVPVFLGLRAGYYLAHPVHRETVLSGACPQSDLLSLDWFSVGILATGLPVALQDLGPWLAMNAVFLLGLFVLPRFVRDGRYALGLKLGAIGLGSGLFLYANYGGLLTGVVAAVPEPAVLGPVATLRLSDATTTLLVRTFNSLLLGPPVVALVGFTMNRILTRPELTSIPVVRHSLPRRDPARVVLVSAALGTVFYLLVVALATGSVVVVP